MTDRQPSNSKPPMIAIIFAPAAHGELKRPALTLLGGKALLAWTLECAVAANSVTEIVIVTDDHSTAFAAGRLGRGPKPVRVVEMAEPLTPLAAVREVAQGRELGDTNFCLLHVAAPLRAPWDIDAAAGILLETLLRRDESLPLSVTSMGGCLGSPSLERMRWVVRDFSVDKRLSAMRSGLARLVFTLSQHPEMPNLELCSVNSAITLMTSQYVSQWLAEPGELMPAERLAYIMPDDRSLEIETESDLRRAQAILGLRYATTVVAPSLAG